MLRHKKTAPATGLDRDPSRKAMSTAHHTASRRRESPFPGHSIRRLVRVPVQIGDDTSPAELVHRHERRSRMSVTSLATDDQNEASVSDGHVIVTVVDVITALNHSSPEPEGDKPPPYQAFGIHMGGRYRAQSPTPPPPFNAEVDAVPTSFDDVAVRIARGEQIIWPGRDRDIDGDDQRISERLEAWRQARGSTPGTGIPVVPSRDGRPVRRDVSPRPLPWWLEDGRPQPPLVRLENGWAVADHGWAATTWEEAEARRIAEQRASSSQEEDVGRRLEREPALPPTTAAVSLDPERRTLAQSAVADDTVPCMPSESSRLN